MENQSADYRPTTKGSTDYDRQRYIDQCIKDCLACYQECMSCISHCLSEGGKHAEQKHITLMFECAEVCRTSADLMMLKGEFSYDHCQVCAKICDACEKSCREIDPSDEMMNRCADMCKKCAESCRSMAH